MRWLAYRVTTIIQKFLCSFQNLTRETLDGVVRRDQPFSQLWSFLCCAGEVPLVSHIYKRLWDLKLACQVKTIFTSDSLYVQCEADVETGEPKDELLPEAKTLIGNLGCNYTKISEILESKDEKLYSEITAGLERANKKAVSHAQRVNSANDWTCIQWY